ncbi:MAG: S-layer homology domain-containing protein [Oscillospiraceae bacterium]|nr:S-layer homology domain-containing protein [Oscillospiraceae bacterium]
MRKFLALVLALVMTMSLVTISAGAATDFTDDAKITNAEAVEVLNAIGILGGYADGSFRPQATLTRGAGAKMVAYLMLGQEAADNLKATYTVFEDVTDTVGLAPYIEWAAANGIVGGYGDGNFGPYNTLTEYAFGKMLLTAIGFDAEEQGYVGAGWQKAVYRDAISKGIYDGTESYGACTRDTAAGMAFNTLKTTYVVYGDKQVAGRYQIGGVWYEVNANITVNGVHDTTLPVWATYEGLIYNENANDKWGNFGERWVYEDEEIAFYEDEVAATYTTQVDYCDLLVDLGIPENNNTDIDLYFVYNGDVTTNGNGTTVYAVAGETWDDEFDYAINTWHNVANPAPEANVFHQNVHYTCDDNFIGGQGVLTKVFEVADDTYVVTEVATYLAQAEAPVRAHNSVWVTAFDFEYRSLENFGEAADDHNNNGARDLHTDVTAVATTTLGVNGGAVSAQTNAYAEDDYVLLTLELNDNGALVVDAHQAAVGTTAVLNHYVTAAQASPAVGSTNRTPDAFGFDLGYEYKTQASLGETYVFYHDTYGNVIGITLPDDASSWLVLDSIYSNHPAGVNTLTAAVVGLDGTTTAGVNVAKFNGEAAKDVDAYMNLTLPAFGDTTVLEIAAQNAGHTRHLYKFTVAGSDYTLEGRQAETGVDTYNAINRTVVDDNLVANNGTVELSATTQFVLRDTKGNYKAVTGYANLPMLVADYAEVVMNAAGTAAAVVYLDDVAYDGDMVLGYIVNPSFTGGVNHVDGEDYYQFNLYVDGIKREVLVSDADMQTITTNGRQMYEVRFDAVDGLLAVRNIVALTKAHDIANANGDNYTAGVTITTVSATALKIKTTADNADVRLDLAQVYLVDTTSGGTDVSVGALSDLSAGQTVDLVYNDDGYIVAIYVIQ